ncbi:MAG: rhomboid family intramembrane serine protease [Candidatus Bathyarchaeota archaeon]|nr:rhomboid family intramembrane serine protease [Candidatus Bathyarchaeota archaeon]
MPDSQKFKPTYILIAVNIAVYVYTSVAGGDFLNTSVDMIWQYGQVNGLVLYYGWYWQLFTSMFVHASITHLVGNMLFLFIFGLRGEEMFSLSEYLAVYFLGGLTGNVLSLVFLPIDIPSAGASGAIFALFGACTVYARRAVGQSIIGALIYAFFLVLLSSGPNVNNSAHIGGLLAGLLIGYVLAMKRKPAAVYKIRYSYTYGF